MTDPRPDHAEGDRDQTAGTAALANRLRRRQRHLRKWARRLPTTAWRLYDHDLPDQPLVVDWYDGWAVVWSQHRTRDSDAEAHRAWREQACSAVARGLDLAADRVVAKKRRRQADRQHGGQYQPLPGGDGRTVVIEEQGRRFLCHLDGHLDVGLFLDHRPLRQRVETEAAGRRCLNLFAYTGSFTVAARRGGAATTTTVDLSATYLEHARRNLAINDLDPDHPNHRLVRADALTWMDQAADQGQRFDLVVCDPPSFSNSKATRHDFVVDRDQARLLQACRRLLAAGGTCYFSTNLRRFSLDEACLVGLEASEISGQTIPEDCARRPPHRCWLLRRS